MKALSSDRLNAYQDLLTELLAFSVQEAASRPPTLNHRRAPNTLPGAMRPIPFSPQATPGSQRTWQAQHQTRIAA